MKRRVYRSACAALALIALILTGCPLKSLIIEIPDFESNLVQGMQLWRVDDEVGESFGAASRMVFGDCSLLENGTETLEYTLIDAQNEPVEGTSPAIVVRGRDGDSAVLYFFLQNWSEPPGWIRASSFNDAGESDLSEEAIFL